MKTFAVIFFYSVLAFSFSQSCRDIDGDYLQFSIETENRDNGAFAFKVRAFEDEACKIPYLEFTQYFTQAALKGQKLDLKTEKVTYRILSGEVAQALNQIGFCDIKNWKPFDEVNVSGRLCDDFQQLKKNEMLFQLFSYENDLLKFGKTTAKLNGKSAALRPVEFDTFNYTK